MRISFILLTLSLLSAEIFAVPTTLTLPEKEYFQYVQGLRTRKFSDREIDRLHFSLAKMLSEIKLHVETNTVKNAARYKSHTPEPEETLFLKDKDGKEFFTIFIGQGVSWEDYPTSNIYNTRVYIYPGDDKKSLAKVIVQYIKVNSNGNEYVKEMVCLFSHVYFLMFIRLELQLLAETKSHLICSIATFVMSLL
jgi:hypothetical protein